MCVHPLCYWPCCHQERELQNALDKERATTQRLTLEPTTTKMQADFDTKMPALKDDIKNEMKPETAKHTKTRKTQKRRKRSR